MQSTEKFYGSLESHLISSRYVTVAVRKLMQQHQFRFRAAFPISTPEPRPLCVDSRQNRKRPGKPGRSRLHNNQQITG
jgi:hypothetical protein